MLFQNDGNFKRTGEVKIAWLNSFTGDWIYIMITQMKKDISMWHIMTLKADQMS